MLNAPTTDNSLPFLESNEIGRLETKLRLVTSNDGKSKFDHFDLNKWNETQHYPLEDSDEQFFV